MGTGVSLSCFTNALVVFNSDQPPFHDGVSLGFDEDHGVVFTQVVAVHFNSEPSTARSVPDLQAEENDFAIAASASISSQPG